MTEGAMHRNTKSLQAEDMWIVEARCVKLSG